MPKARVDLPYKLKFDGVVIKALSMGESEKLHIAEASLDKLKKFLPSLDFDKNFDLLGFALNCYTPNLGNRNGHICSGKQGIAMAPIFVGKYVDFSHERDKIIGYITNYGFSSFPDDSPLTEDEANKLADQEKVFNVVLSGVLWRATNPDFIEFVESSADPSSKDYGKISASWEIGFKEFNIAKGSKYLADCEIIDDPKEIERLKSSLQVFDGNGSDPDDGKPIFLNVIGDTVLSMGIGLVDNPAAYVKGIVVTDEPETETPEEENNEDELKSKRSQNLLSENNLEKKQDLNVIKQTEAHTQSIMKIEKLEDITDETLKEIKASAVSKFIEDSLAKNSEEWQKKVATKEKETTVLSETVAGVQKEIEVLKAEKAEADKKIAALEGQIASKEAEDKFQIRMASLDEKYELSDEDRSVIVEEIKACAADEDFDKWFKKFEILAKEKSKVAIEARKQELEAAKKPTEIVAAVVTPAAEVVLAATPETPNIPNVVTPEVTLKERMAAAFGGDNIKISVSRK